MEKINQSAPSECELIERLASIEHDRWAHWQRHMHAQCEKMPDGSLRIPPDLVKKWSRQATTDYASLDEGEKDSDRQQVLKYFPTVREHYSGNQQEIS